MKLSIASLAFAAATITQSSAFTVSVNRPSKVATFSTQTQIKASALPMPYFMDEINATSFNEVPDPKPANTKKAINPKLGGAASHKEGIFSPLVLAAKELVVGDNDLNKIRGKAIGLHSKVITSFVGTHETVLGNSIMLQLFALMDNNKDGIVDEGKLAAAFKTLGFSWLKEKQISGIIKRAGSEDGLLQLEQFKQEFPKTLRINLTKLAKKNGGELGFLV